MERIKKYEINVGVYLYLCLLGFSWISHVYIYILRLITSSENYIEFICLVLTCLSFGIGLHISSRYISLKMTKITYIDYLCLILGTMYFLMKVVFPDDAFDTTYYAIDIQNHAFFNRAQYGESFHDKAYMYALGDRVYFYFRKMLGYRLSILPNFLIYVLIYFQIKEILGYKIKNNIHVSFFTMVIILVEQFVAILYTMKIDLFIIPLFIELIKLAIFKTKLQKSDYLYAGFLCALSIAIKYSNIIIVLPVIIFAIIEDHKSLDFNKIIAAFIPVAIILAPYLIYTLSSVGNPTYPYYNHIFQGAYGVTDRLDWDVRWGPQNFREFLFWPIYNFIIPQYRFYELGYCSGRMALGYGTAVIFLIMSFIKRKNDRLVKLNILLIVEILLWAGTSGYGRYGIPIEILAGIVVVYDIFEWKTYTKKSYSVCAGLICIFLGIQFIYAQGIITYKNIDWKDSNNSFFIMDTHIKREEFFKEYYNNATLLLRDRGNIISENKNEIYEELKQVDLWIDNYTSLYTAMLKPQADTYFDNNPFLPTKYKQLYYDNIFKNYNMNSIYAIGNSPNGIGADTYAQNHISQLGFKITKTWKFYADFSVKELYLYKLTPIM